MPLLTSLEAAPAEVALPPGTPLTHRVPLEAVADELRTRDPAGEAISAVPDPRALARVLAATAVVEGLDEVLAVLPERLVSRWTLASWLVSGQRDLGGESPLALLRGRSPEPGVGAARCWAAALAT